MDHERVNIHGTPISCGVLVLSRINDDTLSVLYALGSRIYHPSRGYPVAFFVWSDMYKPGCAPHASERLANAVQQRGLGEVSRSPPAENPRTGNPIMIYSWGINHEAFKAHCAAERKQRYKRAGT